MASEFRLSADRIDLRRGNLPWSVILTALVTCAAIVFCYWQFGPRLVLRLAATPLAIEGPLDDFGSTLHRAVLAGGTSSTPARRVFLVGSSSALAVYSDPAALENALTDAGIPDVEVVLLAHRGQTALGSVALTSIAKASGKDLIVLGVTDFDLLGPSRAGGEVGPFDVLGRLIPKDARLCRVRTCPTNDIYLLQRQLRAILSNLLTGHRPLPTSGTTRREDTNPALVKAQRLRLSRALASDLTHGVNANRRAEFGAMLDDLLHQAPDRVVAVLMPVSPDFALATGDAKTLQDGHMSLVARLEASGIPLVTAVAEQPLLANDFMDAIHVWPESSPRLLGKVLAPALAPFLVVETQ